MQNHSENAFFDLACESSKSPACVDRIRILVVDDAPDVVELICALLGWESAIEVVGTADNGFRAVAAVARLEPDLVLLDVNMPGMNGFAAATRLRTYYPSLKIVMASADADSAMPDVCRESGADAFLWKGDLTERLVCTIRSLFPRGLGVGGSDAPPVRREFAVP